MNRADFMNQLESLLQSIAPTEREEAIQYYNDYFDDAGKENEQDVIEALGNPARVAENIKRDLLGNGYGDKPVQKAKASDRALMEYGKDEPDGDGDAGAGEADSGRNAGNVPAGYGQGSESASTGYGQGGGNASAGYGQREGSASTGCAQGSGSTSTGYGRSNENTSTGYEQGGGGNERDSARQTWSSFGGYGNDSQEFSAGEDNYRWNHDTAGWAQDMPEKSRKGRMPVWAVALLVTVLVLASPALAGVMLGVMGLVLGALAGWFGMIFGFGVTAVCLLVAFLALVVTGILCCFSSPWVGMALVGGGLICGCIGLLFLMLTVAMAGIVTPAIFRGIAWVFRAVRGKWKKTVHA